MPRVRLLAISLVLLFVSATANATDFDLSTATIAEINAAMDAGALSSERLVGMYLKRIEAYDKQGPKVNAVITLNKNALAEARALDAERKTKGRRSPLHGIPIVLKDLIDVAGMPTTAGFKPFGAPVPLRARRSWTPCRRASTCARSQPPPPDARRSTRSSSCRTHTSSGSARTGRSRPSRK